MPSGPARALEPTLLVLIGTVGSSLAFDRNAEWVFSVLPSGANGWPVYPRDVALVAMIGALAVVLRPMTTRRVVAAGGLVTVAVCTQAQVGVYALVVTALLAAVTTRRRDGAGRATVVALQIGAIVVVASSWWWIPRVIAAVQSGRLLLDSSPGRSHVPTARPSASSTPSGVVGLLAAGGLLVVWSAPTPQRFFGVWLLRVRPDHRARRAAGRSRPDHAPAPSVVLRRDPDGRGRHHRGRRPAASCSRPFPCSWSSSSRSRCRRRWRSSTPVTTSTRTGRSGRSATSARGSGTTRSSTLRARTLGAHGTVVLVPDVDAAFVWESTGAQPFSLWLSGSTKLGFDPAGLTPWGYLDRVHLQDRAFRAGLPGLCALARGPTPPDSCCAIRRPSGRTCIAC